MTGGAEQLLFETMLILFRDLGLLKRRGRQRTDSTHVLAAVQSLCRLELVGETLRATLNSLAVVAPTWLQAIAPPDWYDRYSDRCENYRLPDGDAARQTLAMTIAADGFTLLHAIYNSPALHVLYPSQQSTCCAVSGFNSFTDPIALPGGYVKTRLQRHR